MGEMLTRIGVELDLLWHPKDYAQQQLLVSDYINMGFE